jgi:hypothetical protein
MLWPLYSRERALNSIRFEAEWVPEPFGMWWWREKFLPGMKFW